MAVKIRLKRLGKKKAPFYRVVVMDSRTKRDGRAIEEIGLYNPMTDPSVIEIDSERAQHWLSVGAQPSDAVAALLKVTGDLQKFKGEAGAEGTYKTAEAKEAFVAPEKGSVVVEKEEVVEEAPAEETVTEETAVEAETAEVTETVETSEEAVTEEVVAQEAPVEETVTEEVTVEADADADAAPVEETSKDADAEESAEETKES